MDFAEIKAAVEKQPELLTQITSSFKDLFIKGAEAEGLIVRTKEQDQQYVDAHVNTQVATKLKDAVGAEFGKAMNEIDAEIKAITGVERNNGEKTTAFAKRAFETLKGKGGDPVTKARVEELEKLLDSTKKEAEEKLAKLETESFSFMVDSAIDTDLDKRSFAVPAHLKTDEEKQKFIKQERDMIKRDYKARLTAKKEADGSIVFHEGDKPKLSTKDAKPLAAGDLITELYSHRFIPSQHNQGGTGTGQQGGGLAGVFKSREDVQKDLAAKGVEAGTKEYMTQYEQLITEHKL